MPKGDEEVRDLGDDMKRFVAGDYPVETETDEAESLKRLATKQKGAVLITILPRYGTKTLTRAEDTIVLEMTNDKLEENVKTIKTHLKKLLDSKVVDKMMTKVMEEIKHG